MWKRVECSSGGRRSEKVKGRGEEKRWGERERHGREGSENVKEMRRGGKRSERVKERRS